MLTLCKCATRPAIPVHYQLKSVVDYHELSENLDYDVYWLTSGGLINPTVNQPEPSPKPEFSLLLSHHQFNQTIFRVSLAIEYSRFGIQIV